MKIYFAGAWPADKSLGPSLHKTGAMQELQSFYFLMEYEITKLLRYSKTRSFVETGKKSFVKIQNPNHMKKRRLTHEEQILEYLKKHPGATFEQTQKALSEIEVRQDVFEFARHCVYEVNVTAHILKKLGDACKEKVSSGRWWKNRDEFVKEMINKKVASITQTSTIERVWYRYNNVYKACKKKKGE